MGKATWKIWQTSPTGWGQPSL